MRLISRGFSMTELLITVLVASTVIAVATPAFGTLIARNRQTAEINALYHAVFLARKEAIRRKRRVALCPAPDGLSCSPGSDWSKGWLLFENTNGDEPPRNDPGEPLILSHRPGTAVTITANRRGFTSRGIRRRATNGTLVVCDVAGRIPPKAVVVSYTGRPRVARARPGGKPYTCAD